MKNLKIFIVISLASSTLTACATQPKPRALVSLTENLQDPALPRIRQVEMGNALISEARQLEAVANAAYDDGDVERAEEAAILGNYRYKTAQAFSEKQELQAEHDGLNDKLRGINEELQKKGETANKLSEEVGKLEIELKRKQLAAAGPAKVVPQEASASATRMDYAIEREVRGLLGTAEAEKAIADKVEAAKYAPQKYAPAANRLKTIKELVSASQFNSQMANQLKSLIKDFGEAAKIAAPLLNEARVRANPELRRANIRKDLRMISDPLLEIVDTADGVRIVLPSLFDKGSSLLDGRALTRLRKIVEVISKYDEFTIYVEGFSSKMKSATEALTISQVRAAEVANYIATHDAKKRRPDTTGSGQKSLRYPESSLDNDRVEIVVRRTR